jgi:malate dehydrogenase (oxaloacetate-decarboxylating)
MDIKQESLDKHAELQGKIEITSKAQVNNAHDLSVYYTPGVGAVSSEVAEHPERAKDLTIAGNTIAVISDGTAVLGLGDIGPQGALPVMEGKAMLFKELAGVNAFPIVLDVHTADEIVATIKAIAPGFAGINLEDIAAPICFDVEDRLKAELNIPVMHDDQHGTAVVVLAGLINACKVTDRKLDDSTIVIVGAGAAGNAVARLIAQYATDAEVLLVDSKGIVVSSRADLDPYKAKLADVTNKNGRTGSLQDAVKGADIVIGLSRANLLTADDIRTMATDPIVFGLSNPTPEIMPDEAKAGGAAVIATGRSDFPNQINNVLVFPGIFRGALDAGVPAITDEMKLAAAEALAALVEAPDAEHIIPDVLDKRVVPAIAAAIHN